MTAFGPSFHVAGVLVQALPNSVAAVRDRIAHLDGAVVHAAHPAGALVVTLESEDPAAIEQALSRLQSMQGVLSAVLVSEHSEPLAAADQEIPHEPSPADAA